MESNIYLCTECEEIFITNETLSHCRNCNDPYLIKLDENTQDILEQGKVLHLEKTTYLH